MLVTFKTDVGNITMFGSDALQMIKIIDLNDFLAKNSFCNYQLQIFAWIQSNSRNTSQNFRDIV